MIGGDSIVSHVNLERLGFSLIKKKPNTTTKPNKTTTKPSNEPLLKLGIEDLSPGICYIYSACLQNSGFKEVYIYGEHIIWHQSFGTYK